MKSYTDIKQSKRLAEILPRESADMYWMHVEREGFNDWWKVETIQRAFKPSSMDIPCWSLAALLSVLPNTQGRYTKSLYWFDGAWHCEYVDEDGAGILGTSADNAIDACYEMISNLL